ncbi:hypothetical protein [Desulforhabdus amnigena]|uniref:Uncharacterized protein n=1 Tax=Desulforhabdus amnigena TaxID=40218 RepID=A0A9W6D452_9BACT|nr:hypothetical protein [Desulforhabdus amnigena]NLJ27377.1 hypothetical protein [Deltaproteobacteria bacterium]GLI34223.1 hypothetical protein DAMNIGENAA_16560 [Desulforhabdus amnigena]
MSGFGQFLCVELKRSVASMLPWDIPWYDLSHTVFFSALYGVLTVMLFGVLTAVLITIKRVKKGGAGEEH